jgi:3-phenylpropionate/cinnamic acid dioxygenase small subunit
MAATPGSNGAGEEVTLEEHLQVTRFLNREAQMLDERRYRDWLGLLTDDIEYRVPVRSHRQSEGVDDDWAIAKELSGESALALTSNRYAQLEIRVARLLSGKAHTENPPWFTERLISNIDVRHGTAPDSFEVASKFLLNRYKMDREQTIVGSRQDTLVRSADGLRLQRRQVLFNAAGYRWGAYVLI